MLLIMFIRRELGGTGTRCLFQFTYCEYMAYRALAAKKLYSSQENTLSINLTKLPSNIDTTAAVFGITFLLYGCTV